MAGFSPFCFYDICIKLKSAPVTKSITLLITFLFFFPLFSQSKLDGHILDAYFKKMVRDWEVPSATIGIVKDGHIVFTGNYGHKEIGKDQAPDENTLYAIASNSKAFTTALIGMLVEEGKLNWNDKVKKHLPYFELYDPWVSQEVTIRDLLCHRVGLGTFSGDVIWYKADLTSEEIIRRIKHLPKAYNFRAGYGYSNLMYITAGELIRKITGKSWGENVRQRILKPLGMDRTITTVRDLDAKGNFATPHARENDKNIPIAWEDWEQIAATGGIISSVADICKWMIFNLNHGIHNGDTLLSKSTRNLIWTPHNNFVVDHTSANNFDRHFNGYGLGWGLSDYRGKLRVGHTGGYDGMITAVNLIPDENLGVVVLTNGMQSPIMAATYYALDMMLEGKSEDWSSTLLEQRINRDHSDTRISKRNAKRIPNTAPSVALNEYGGVYHSDIYGDIHVKHIDDQWRIEFEHSPTLSASLEHWHYDVYEIKWDQPHAWFSFGTVQFVTNSDMKVTGLEFNVPNNDIFFEELKPYKVSNRNNIGK